MNSAGDAFGFPFRSPGWFGTVVLQGLILIIPIIGQIALLGWVLLTLDNLRAGRQELAPAGFHLERGISLFGVTLIYGIVIGIIPFVLYMVGLGQMTNGGGSGLLTLAGLLAFVAGLFNAFLLPVLVLRTSQGGFSAGMDVGAVWQQATANVGQTIVAALLIYVAELIGSLFFILCIIPGYFGLAWAFGVAAGVVSWYERSQGGATAPTY